MPASDADKTQPADLQVAVEERAHRLRLGNRCGTPACSRRDCGIVKGEPDANIDRDDLLRSRAAGEKRADR